MITFFFKNNLTLKFYIMAIVKMGALVTEIIGSLGGTAFKRQNGTQVMFKKSNGASRSKVLQNPRLVQNSTIFKKWTTLTLEVQSAWNTLASTNKVKDKFGNDVNISGINFQRKCDLQSNFLGVLPNPLFWSSSLPSFSFVGSPELDWTHSTFDIQLKINESTANFALMLEYSLNPLQSPVFISRRVWFFGEFEDNVSRDLFDEFFVEFPFLDSAYNLRLYLYCMNNSGVVSAVIQKDIVLI
jgi:hypothetical protein